jgi:hypothetical protein
MSRQGSCLNASVSTPSRPSGPARMGIAWMWRMPACPWRARRWCARHGDGRPSARALAAAGVLQPRPRDKQPGPLAHAPAHCRGSQSLGGATPSSSAHDSAWPPPGSCCAAAATAAAALCCLACICAAPPLSSSSTLLPLPATAVITLGMVVASWLLPTAPMTRNVLWSADTTDMLRGRPQKRGAAATCGQGASARRSQGRAMPCMLSLGATLHRPHVPLRRPHVHTATRAQPQPHMHTSRSWRGSRRPRAAAPS